MKQAERQKAAQEKAKKKGTGNSRKRKEGEYSGTSSAGTNPKKTKAAKSNIGLQGQEVLSNECAACFGLYEDVDPDSGDITREWIQCTDEDCGVWMHTECLDKCDDDFAAFVEPSSVNCIPYNIMVFMLFWIIELVLNVFKT